MAKIISAQKLADQVVSKVRTPMIPYVLGGRSDKGTDCINLVAWCMNELGGRAVSRGSNTAWREDMANTWELPFAKKSGLLLPGTLLFIADPPTAKWPDGDYGHAGVFVGDGYRLKTPDGKLGNVVHASASRGGVYPSTLQNGWTHAAWLEGVDYGNTIGAGSDTSPDNRNGSGDVGAGGASGIASPTMEPGPDEAKVITTSSGLNLRKFPDAKSAPIKEMPKGTIVKVLGIADGWAQVRWDVAPGLWHIGWCRIEKDGVDYLSFG